MFIYKKIPLFNRYSGKEDGFDRDPVSIVDDFSGEIIQEGQTSYSLRIEYNSDIEEAWYYDNLPKFLKPEDESEACPSDFYGWLSSFWGDPYHFLRSSSDTYDNSFSLITSWLRAKSKNDIFFNCSSIEEAFRRSRLRTFSKLLADGKVTLDNFGDLKA
jgi:hypothetical protein